MALIRLGLGSQVSGSIGGTTFSHNRGGAYIRSRAVPVNVNSPRQVAVRVGLSQTSFSWTNDLTEEERAGWNLYAQNVAWTNTIGESIQLSGFNMFLRTNMARRDAGLPLLKTAPTVFTLGDLPSTFTPTLDVSDQNVSIAFNDTDPWANEVGGFVNVYMGRPFNVGITFFNGPWQYIGTILGAATPPTSPAVFSTPSFVFALGQQVALRWRAGTADGRVSPFGRGTFLPVP